MTYSLLPWTMEQDEPPDECWYVIQDGEGQVVCFATKDDAEIIVRAVNTHQALVEALETIAINIYTDDACSHDGYNNLCDQCIAKAALDAAKGSDK